MLRSQRFATCTANSLRSPTTNPSNQIRPIPQSQQLGQNCSKYAECSSSSKQRPLPINHSHPINSLLCLPIPSTRHPSPPSPAPLRSALRSCASRPLVSTSSATPRAAFAEPRPPAGDEAPGAWEAGSSGARGGDLHDLVAFSWGGAIYPSDVPPPKKMNEKKEMDELLDVPMISWIHVVKDHFSIF